MKDVTKKAYERPQIARIELRVDEAVLANCKRSDGGGVNQPIGISCSTGNLCQTAPDGS